MCKAKTLFVVGTLLLAVGCDTGSATPPPPGGGGSGGAGGAGGSGGTGGSGGSTTPTSTFSKVAITSLPGASQNAGIEGTYVTGTIPAGTRGAPALSNSVLSAVPGT